MPAEIEFYDSDGTTLITDYDWPTLLAGATGAAKKLFFKNVDTRTWKTVVLTVEPVGDNDGDEIARVGATEFTTGTTPVAVGDVDPLELVEFWQKQVTTGGMSNTGNPRSWDIGITETG